MTMKSEIYLGIATGFLAVLVISLVTSLSFASPQGNNSDPGQGIIVPNYSGPDIPVVFDHITRAQESLQNGDTEGANNHLELAKQSLGRAVPDEQGFIGSGRTDEIPVPDN